MEGTQSFRLTETLGTTEIVLSHVKGQNMISWEGIEQAFPGVRRVRDGTSVIKFHRFHNQHSVNCCPHSALDVAFSTSVKPAIVNPSECDTTDRHTDLTEASADYPVEDRVITALNVTQQTPVGNFDPSPSSPSCGVDASSKTTFFQQIVTRASRKARESEIEQRFISLLAPEDQETVRASSDIYQAFTKAIKDNNGALSRADLKQELGGFFQKQEAIMVTKNTELQEELSAMRKEMNAKQEEIIKLQEGFDFKQEEMIKLQEGFDFKQEEMIKLQEGFDFKQEEVIRLQEEMKQMHQRALDQLSVLQSRVKAVLTQTYELHEYPIPRLFIVLPQYPSEWDIIKPFTDKYRLYFLCECGEHTKAVGSNDKIPHKIHLAKHEGYELARPTEFFQQYGPYVLTILKMLKYGVSVASVAVPAVAHLVNADALDQAAKGLQHLKDCIEPGIDQIISKIEKDSVDEGEPVDNFADQMESKETLEGADLRKLETFLKDKDGNKVMGNLYRIVTDEGHVKWVCIDHYRENYQESTARDFQRTLDTVGGSFDKSLGRIEVTLRSRVLAEQFFSALGKARSVYELNIVFDWACTTSDLEQLEVALKTSTRVSILQLNLQQFQTSKLVSTSSQYRVLFRFPKVPSMKTVHIILAFEHAKRISFQPTAKSHPCKLSFKLTSGRIKKDEFGRLALILKTNSALITLDLYNNSIRDDGAKALAEALKTNSALITLNLGDNSIGSDGAKALAEALKTNSALITLSLYSNSIRDDGAKALAEALKTNSALITLDLGDNSIGSDGAKALAEALKTNSALTTLDLYYNSIGDDGAKALAEALKTNSVLVNGDW